MLIAALIGFAFDMQHSPARLRIAVRRAIPLHRCRIGPIIAAR